jgi:hypothetical protein
MRGILHHKAPVFPKSRLCLLRKTFLQVLGLCGRMASCRATHRFQMDPEWTSKLQEHFKGHWILQMGMFGLERMLRLVKIHPHRAPQMCNFRRSSMRRPTWANLHCLCRMDRTNRMRRPFWEALQYQPKTYHLGPMRALFRRLARIRELRLQRMKSSYQITLHLSLLMYLHTLNSICRLNTLRQDHL